MAIFPDKMLGKDLTLDVIAEKFTYFHVQLQLNHWQTKGFAEHEATGKLYSYIYDLKDDVIEKIMGYTNKRVGNISPKIDNKSSLAVVNELLEFATSLKDFAAKNSYHDIGNLADSLSGEAAKVKYLLTLS